jgi:hypothetical protein
MGDTERFEEWEGRVAVCEGLGRTAGIIYMPVRPEPVEGSPRSGCCLLIYNTKANSPVVDRQLVTFSCFAKEKVTKKKATPVYRPYGVPCVARLVRRLRNSHCVLKQSSPKSPDQPALLGGAQGNKKQKMLCALRAQTFVLSPA